MTIFRLSDALRRPALVGAALVGLAGFGLLAAPAARAFTFQDQDPGAGARSDDTSMFYNSGSGSGAAGQPSSRLDSDSRTVFKHGNSSFSFGGQTQTFDQRNNPNAYFTPDYLMGR